MVDGLKEIHASYTKKGHLDKSQQEVNDPEPLGRLRNPRGQLVGRYAGCFGHKELHATDAQKGQDGNGQHDDAHTTDPVCEAAPVKQAFRNGLNIRNDGGSGGGKSAHGFENGIHRVRNHTADEKRQRTEERHAHPAKGNDQIPFPFADLCMVL